MLEGQINSANVLICLFYSLHIKQWQGAHTSNGQNDLPEWHLSKLFLHTVCLNSSPDYLEHQLHWPWFSPPRHRVAEL